MSSLLTIFLKAYVEAQSSDRQPDPDIADSSSLAGRDSYRRAAKGGETGQPRTPIQLEEALLLAAVSINILVALAAHQLPYQDSTAHLTRYLLIDKAWRGIGPDWVDVRLIPTAYIGLDLVGAVLVHLFGPFTTLKITAAVPLVLMPFGMYALIRRTSFQQRGWSLVAAIFGFSWNYLYSHINYVIGIGLALVWLAIWWPHRGEATWRRRCALALGIIVLFSVHLSAPLVVLSVVWLDYAADTYARRGRAGTSSALLSARLATALVTTVALGAVWSAMEMANTEGPTLSEAPVFRSLPNKLGNFASPFYSFSGLQAGIMGLGYLVAVGALLRRVKRAELLNGFALSSALFLLLFLVSPASAHAAGHVDVRWLLPAYLLPFCMPSSARPPTVRVMVTLFVCCVAHAAFIHSVASRIDRELADYDRVLARVPATPLLPLVADQQRYGRVSPYLHYAMWHTIRKGARVPGQYSGTGVRDGSPTNYYMNHFRLRSHLYYPLTTWGVTDFSPLNCNLIRRDYQFVVQAGLDERAAKAIRRCAKEDFRAGEFVLYRVLPSDSVAR